MAKKGRKSTPTKIKLVRGNPGKRPVSKSEPIPTHTPVEILLKKPVGLTGPAATAWGTIAPRLNDMRVLTIIDRTALRLLCEQIGIYKAAQKEIKKNKGFTTITDKGNLVQHPAVSVMNSAFKNIRVLLAEFGMTPSSRTGLKVIPDDEERSGFGALNG